MADPYSRTRLLLGDDGIEKLRHAHVALFGLGGVGSYTAEALARSGIGKLDLIDDDVISPSNLNRQLLATHSAMGQYKVDLARQRIADIDPDIEVRCFKTFFLPETAAEFDFSQYDYVVDAIDTVAGKLALITACKAAGTPIVCAMGTGNKLDPTAFRVADISKTRGCALARVLRKECAKRGLKNVQVVYSEELPTQPQSPDGDATEAPRPGSSRRSTPGSTAFVPGVAGLILAGVVVRNIVGI